MKKRTKIKLIQALEGKTIRTADGHAHVVTGGRFRTAKGETMCLEQLSVYHLRLFARNAGG